MGGITGPGLPGFSVRHSGANATDGKCPKGSTYPGILGPQSANYGAPFGGYMHDLLALGPSSLLQV